MKGKTYALLFPLLLLAACKGGSIGASKLKDAAPPQVPAGWVSLPADSGEYTMSFPEGWQIEPMPADKFEGWVKSMNENAWTILNQEKAEVDFSKAKAIYGARDASVFDFTNPNKTEEQMFIIVREDLGHNVGQAEAADRWRDTVRIEGENNPPKETKVTLPVGEATVLSKQNMVMGDTDRMTVYVLVDGTIQYTFFFVETFSKNAAQMPLKEIMSTFRVKRG